MSASRHADYEALVRTLVNALVKCVPPESIRDAYQVVGHGPRNRLLGASGHLHQIDVSVETPSVISLFECKCHSRPVGISHVSVLAIRKQDIQGIHSGKDVLATIVSMGRVTTGALKIAKHFGVRIDTVASAEDYHLKVLNTAKSAVVCRAKGTVSVIEGVK